MKLSSLILGRAISGLTAVKEKKASALVKGSLGERGAVVCVFLHICVCIFAL